MVAVCTGNEEILNGRVGQSKTDIWYLVKVDSKDYWLRVKSKTKSAEAKSIAESLLQKNVDSVNLITEIKFG